MHVLHMKRISKKKKKREEMANDCRRHIYEILLRIVFPFFARRRPYKICLEEFL